MAGRGPIGMFNIMLRTPEMFDAMRGVTGGGPDSPLSAKQRESAILLNGRFWTTQFEFLVHHRAALQAGLNEATANAIIEGRRPATLLPDEEPVYNFLTELLNAKQVRDATFQAAKDRLTARGIVDLKLVYLISSVSRDLDKTFRKSERAVDSGLIQRVNRCPCALPNSLFDSAPSIC